MATILPSILTDDRNEYIRRVNLLGDYVGMFHIDVMDGEYVPSKSVSIKDGAAILTELRSKHEIELHLMVKDPEQYVADVLLVPHLVQVVIHPNSTNDLTKAISVYKEAGIAVGLSFQLGKAIILPDIPFDFFLVLAEAKPGYSGTPFDQKGIEQIRWIRAYHPEYPIEIDGGMNEKHAKEALEAGATRLIVNSYIFKSENPVQTLQFLQHLSC